MAALQDAATRRAAWWRYLAELVLESAGDLVLVRYEELVADPRRTLDRILDGYPAGRATETISPSEPRKKADALDAADVQATAGSHHAAIKLGVYRVGA